MLESLHFIRPWWLVGLLPVIVVCVLWARHRAGRSHWETQIAPELLAVLLESANSSRFNSKVWAVAAALAVATVGLAGPTWERLPQPVTQKTDATIVVLDLSLSMFAEDLAPSRLVRARQKITDILRLRQEGVTGLVAYAGDAHVVAPLTDDTRTIENLLSALSPAMMPVLGSDPMAAMALTRELFTNSGYRQGRILLITDGVRRPSEIAAYAAPSFPVSIMGVGTSRGGTIPLDFANQRGQVLTDQQGQTVVARLDEAALAGLASRTHGRYRTLTLQDDDILDLLETPLPSSEATSELEREFDVWADMGYWACILLLPLVLLGFRRGVLVCVCLACVPPPASANLWDDLWLRRDQQGYNAIQQGRPDEASGLFADPQWRASAQYQGEDYPSAAQGFAADPTTTGYYNLGNALAKQGQFEEAIAAYTQALDQDPSHEDAAFNKALVEGLLKDQQSSEEQAPQQQPNEQGEGQDSRNESEPQGADQPGDEEQDAQQAESEQDPDGEEPQPSEPGEEQSSEQMAQSRDEQQDALEQWLRRVPDEPGGLLRRKFRYETNQRLRSGDYSSQAQEQVW